MIEYLLASSIFGIAKYLCVEAWFTPYMARNMKHPPITQLHNVTRAVGSGLRNLKKMIKTQLVIETV